VFMSPIVIQQDVRDTTTQTKLDDFDEKSGGKWYHLPVPSATGKRVRSKPQLWHKIRQEGEEWGVCNLDGTVMFVQLADGRIHAHGMEAVCRWCGDALVIRDSKLVFCGGTCGRYQGEYSADPDAYLRWEGAKSYTLRKEIARVETLQLEPRDLEPISYAPNWSVFDDYEEDESDSHDSSTAERQQ